MKKQTKINEKKKKKLSSLIMLLFITVVMLGVSTYAWFTSNRLVRVNSLDISVQASEGFQISVDGVNWKSVVDTTDILGAASSYPSNINHVPTAMVPVSTAASASNATTGLLDFFLGKITTDSTGQYVIYGDQIVETTTTGSFIAFDLFFRTNNPIALALEQTAGVIDNATLVNRQNKGIENAARVGFVRQGSLTPEQVGTAGSPTAAAALAQAIVYGTNEADYQAALTTLDTTPDDATALGVIEGYRNGSNVIIWEPNSDTHTEAAETEMANMFGLASGDLVGPQVYDGIKAPIAKFNDDISEGPLQPVKTYLRFNEETSPGSGVYVDTEYNNEAKNPVHFKEIPQARFVRTTKLRTISDEPVPKPLGLSLPSGITKYRIYMWLEGQDWDCYDSASGSDIQWNLALTIAS